MLDQLAAAFDRGDYRTAAELLKTLLKDSPKNPWTQFYTARLHEVTGKVEIAEKLYRMLLRDTINPKLALQARHGLQRLEEREKAQRQQAIAQATADPANTGLGFLVLEPVSGPARAQAIQSFAKVMKLDPHVVKLILPGRNWQLYRTGPIGELQVYGQELRTAGVPNFWVAQGAIQAIQVLRVNYIESIAPQVTVICQNDQDQVGSLTFDWQEVTQRVQGFLPIFEQVLDLGPWRKLERKEKTQDYAQVYDLHLPGRNVILRFCDETYEFQKSAIASQSNPELAAMARMTVRMNWNQLLSTLSEQLPKIAVWNDFKGFAETTLDHKVPLHHLKSHIEFSRKVEKTHWDTAFQLYSALVFLKPAA